jgi:hypothetical protein
LRLDVEQPGAGSIPDDRLILRHWQTMSRAIEGNRLYRDLDEQTSWRSAEVSRRATSTDPGQMMRETADLFMSCRLAARCAFHGPRRQRIQYEAASGNRAPRHAGLTISLDDQRNHPAGGAHWQSVLAADVAQDPRHTPSPLHPRIRA